MEIKPQDLRVGNKYLHIKAGEITLEQDSIPYFCRYPELLRGIELTPEWLERANFEKVGNNKYAFYYQGVVLFGYWLLDGTVNIGHFIPASIKYVHQIQNLYFALTGEELAIDKTSLI